MEDFEYPEFNSKPAVERPNLRRELLNSSSPPEPDETAKLYMDAHRSWRAALDRSDLRAAGEWTLIGMSLARSSDSDH